MKTIHKVKIMQYEFIMRTYGIPGQRYIFTEDSKLLISRVKKTQTQCFGKTRKRFKIHGQFATRVFPVLRA